MIIDYFEKLSKRFSKFNNWRIILLASLFLSSLLIIGLPISLRASPYTLKVGDVTFQDIRAPRSFSYTSEILTNQAKDIAEKSVQPVFIPADPLDARRQFENLKQSIEGIEEIRLKDDLTLDQKIQQLKNDPVLFLNDDDARYCISIKNAKWIQVKNESYRVFELIIRNPINSDQLENVKKTIPNFIGYAFSEKDVQLISQLIIPFITINSVYSNEKTNEAVQAAREKVTPVARSYTAGEMIVFSGQVITPTIYETLQYLGLVQQRDEPLDLLSAAFLIIGSLLVPTLYLRQARKQIIDDVSALVLVSILFIIFLLVAKLVITNHTILPFLFPIAAFGLVISSLFDYELGVIGFIPLCILVCYLLSDNLELVVYYLLTATISIFILGKGRRLITFFMTGMGIGIIGSFVILVFRLTSGFINIEEIITLVGVAFLSGLGTMSLTLLLQTYTAVLLGRTTALQLMDLSRPDHPLLQFLLLKAPGTYQHSIQAANLAEQAARAVRADPLLARVGALYHDIGKTSNPAFFIENQEKDEIDAHEDMDPRESANIIIRHVKDGVALAKKYGLPPQIITFITEHHGNTIARFQYMQMLNRNASQKRKINKKNFTYPGRPPRTRETAILMLVDGCEARARAEKPRTESALRKMMKETIDYYVKEQQLDNVNLTLRDLKLIEDSFVYTLSNVSHKRIQYPDYKSKK
jgi:hypothetical protein